jgi:2-C-methyl-D-erythritol 2,4-cyclodiphosphate synthase
VLGGVEVPFNCGLIGWSDADVLIHAIIDALLGAANLGDIGQLFPPGDPKYKGISSLVLLGRVGKKLADKGYTIGNIDTVIIAEQPLLRDFIPKMCCNISQALGIDTIDVSVKANTSEELGFVGREEGMAASAVALVNGK